MTDAETLLLERYLFIDKLIGDVLDFFELNLLNIF